MTKSFRTAWCTKNSTNQFHVQNESLTVPKYWNLHLKEIHCRNTIGQIRNSTTPSACANWECKQSGLLYEVAVLLNSYKLFISLMAAGKKSPPIWMSCINPLVPSACHPWQQYCSARSVMKLVSWRSQNCNCRWLLRISVDMQTFSYSRLKLSSTSCLLSSVQMRSSNVEKGVYYSPFPV